MTKQQERYIADLRNKFRFSQDQARELWRAYKIPGNPHKWGEAEFNRAVEVLNLCGPSYEAINRTIEHGRAEWVKRQSEKVRRAARAA